MTTLADIARKAGVSYSTVSRALADSPLVNAETKERIQRLAAEYGYRVNQVARSLATRTTSTLGLVVPETINPFFPKTCEDRTCKPCHQSRHLCRFWLGLPLAA